MHVIAYVVADRAYSAAAGAVVVVVADIERAGDEGNRGDYGAVGAAAVVVVGTCSDGGE